MLKKWKLRRQLSLADGLLIIVATYLLMKLMLDGGILPERKLAAMLPGGVTVINRMVVRQSLQFLLMTGLTIGALKLRGGTLHQIGMRPLHDKSWRWKAPLCGFLLFAAMLLASSVMVTLLPKLARPQAVTQVISQASGPWEWFAVVVMVCIIGPFSEELLFRGYIYHSMRQYYSVLLSVLVTSLFFGCLHNDLFRLLPLTITGICLNWVSIRSGSVRGSMLAHGVWNFLMTVIVFVM